MFQFVTVYFTMILGNLYHSPDSYSATFLLYPYEKGKEEVELPPLVAVSYCTHYTWLEKSPFS